MAQTKISLGRQTNLDVAGGVITNSGTPTGSTDLVNKAYVDSVANGNDWKASVRAATNVAGTLNTSFANGSAIDDVTLVTGDRILLKNQSSGAENGIYVVAATGSPSRSTDADASSEVTSSLSVFVEEGTLNGDNGFVLTNNGAIVLGTTALVFTQFTGLGTVTTDSTLTKTGNQLSRAAITGDVAISVGSNVSSIGANKVTLGMLSTLTPNSVIGNPTGATATPSAISLSTAATASSIALRDANANARFNSIIESISTTATAGTTTTLTVASAKAQQFTGTTTQTVVLPDATTLSVGQAFELYNRSTGTVTVNSNGGALVQTLAPGSQSTLTLVTNGTAPGVWDSAYSVTAAGGVTTVSVTSANGFSGTVTNPTTTPAITIATSVTGLIKGNGTALSAAVAGTDYLAPTNVVDRETPVGSVNGSNTAFTLAFSPITGSEHVYLNGLLQEPGAGNDYTISGATLTYLTAPLTGDKLRVSYRK